MGIAVALATPAPVLAEDNPLESAGILAFGPGDVLFVGDVRGAAIHAFTLRAGDFTPQNVVLGAV